MRIGFVGVVTQETGTLVAPAGIAGITFTDPVAAANRVADQLSDGSAANGEADVVVLLAHEGAARGAASVTDCATLAGTDDAFGKIVNNTSADVDAIIGGHTHLVVDCEIAGPGGKLRPVLEASEYRKALDRLTMTYDTTTKQVTTASGEVVPLSASAFTADAEVERIVQAAKATADEVGREVIGSVTTDIPRAKTSSGSEDRGEESLLGNFIADVQLDAVNDASQPGGPAQIAFMNPGGLRADIIANNQNAGEQPGEVTYAEVAVVQPFANTLFTLTLTGTEIEHVLEEQYQPDGGSRPFLALGVSQGFRYELDGSKPRGERIADITLNGTPLSPTAGYRVVTNSFLTSGGDNFKTLGTGTDRRDTGLDDLSVLVAYFRAGSPVTPDTADRSVVINRLPAPAPSPSTSATPTATMSPSPSASPSCATTPTVELDPATIIATGSAQVTVRGPANRAVELYAYTRPGTTYRKVRDAVLGADGTTTFRVVPPANTRLYAQVVGCDTDEVRLSKVLNVRTALSLAVERNGVRDYTFKGDSLPARAGGLLISLYRSTDDGRQVLTAQTRADARNRQWAINRTFTGTGRFGFLVRTGQDLQNAPGTSNVRSTLIF